MLQILVPKAEEATPSASRSVPAGWAAAAMVKAQAARTQRPAESSGASPGGDAPPALYAAFNTNSEWSARRSSVRYSPRPKETTREVL